MSMNVRFYLSLDVKITLKSHKDFCHLLRNVIMDIITLHTNL